MAKKAPIKKKKIKKGKSKATYNVVRTHFITKTPMRRMMKEEGASMISDGAVDLLISKLQEIAIKTTKKAMGLVKDENRKRLTAEDITWASEESQ